MPDTLHLINPATETLIQAVPIDDGTTIAQKAQRAHMAQPSWANRPLSDRIEILQRFRDRLVQEGDRLAALLTSETGKPITQSFNELRATPSRIDFFLRHTALVMEPVIMHRDPATDVIPGTAALEEVVTYEPLGVIANISAWNYPYFVGTNVFIPALLTGNTVLYKPSEFATLTGLAIAELLYEVGVPNDVFIPVIGGGVAGAALLNQPLQGVFFTGSHATGLKIAAAAAQQLTRVQLELGGKDPAYVCEDVSVSTVAAALADGAFYNNGQSCCAVERIYVHQHIYDAFIEAFMEAVKGFQLGDPTDAATYLGPVSRKPQLAELQRQVDDAVQKGARLLCGGARVDRPGWYFAPTVLVNVNHEMAVMRDETFGPVIGIQKVASDNEAIALMNDTAYGLTAAVYTPDRPRAVNILSRVRSGTAYWNCCDRVSPYLPWTGRGQSGFGSTLSLDGIRSFVQPRAWHLRQSY
ncbi:aldehyde dehydrogenase family protein [Thermocoleostomius sinensis]|uniref:Aldehyde dehydrogenase family protein n=1 Tax=Thermocoleostomius sinensis A174 TaxID=2016057 RepID=A0A9E9C3X8_9CYAN|nr:aldehyde dehydrogenase family protein [Thermocoleostomius sinensis]WAL59416.1 aldehyde dehydrogenase family protein [Thermocoleostomius sinensis A174]